MQNISQFYKIDFDIFMSWLLIGFYLLFSLFYIIYSIVYLNVIKVLNNTVKTPYAWFFEFLAVIQIILGLGVLILGLNFIF